MNLRVREITKFCKNSRELDLAFVANNPKNGRKERGFVSINPVPAGNQPSAIEAGIQDIR
jgi:hypothetical protein